MSSRLPKLSSNRRSSRVGLAGTDLFAFNVPSNGPSLVVRMLDIGLSHGVEVNLIEFSKVETINCKAR